MHSSMLLAQARAHSQRVCVLVQYTESGSANVSVVPLPPELGWAQSLRAVVPARACYLTGNDAERSLTSTENGLLLAR
jgi:hypothetical protein